MEQIILIIITLLQPAVSVLHCYVCEDCPESKLDPLRYMASCPDKSYVSCITTLTRFANYRTISRTCSKAPAVTRRGRYNHGGAVCSHHTVNIMRATVCLCSRDTCNGPSLPPKDILENDDDVMDLKQMEDMVKEMKAVRSEPVSSDSRTFSPRSLMIFSFMSCIVMFA